MLISFNNFQQGERVLFGEEKNLCKKGNMIDITLHLLKRMKIHF